MEISNVAMSTQQTTGGANSLRQTETKAAESEKNNTEETKVMTKKTISEAKEEYTAVSKDGDTLTLSDNLKSEGDSQKEVKVVDGKVIANPVKMSDAALAKCSGTKLRQLLQQGKISKQQYEKAMKKIAK